MADVLLSERIRKDIVLLKLNRPESFNAFDLTLLRRLEEELEHLGKEELRVLILTGTGKSFCSGADLKEIQFYTPALAKRWSLKGHKIFATIENFTCPVVAAIAGYALGGGCELACACDLRYAAESAKFGHPEARLGMIPGWGGTFRLPGYIGVGRAKELIFTSRLISAQEALTIGLVNQVFPQQKLMENVVKIAEQIASTAPLANRHSKRMLNRYYHPLQRLIREESRALARCVRSEDQTEGVKAFLEKRGAVFKNR